MLISIIVPIYNVAPYVEQCLQSVASQTYQGAMECILVDDCGTDDSMTICERFVAQYDGPIYFRILHHEHNRGLSAARNTGIDAAKGEYIYFLDSDDWIYPECLELMVNCAIKYPKSQIVFAGANVSSGYRSWCDYEHKQFPEFSDDCDWLQLSMLKRKVFGMTAWNKLLSHDFLLRNNLRFIEGLIHEDEIWNFDLSKHVQAAAFVLHNTYYYNVRPNSIVTNGSDNVHLNRLYTIWNLMIARVSNDNKNYQIQGIYKYIYDETHYHLPTYQKRLIIWLYLKLAAKSCNMFSFRLLYQCIKVLW